MSTTIERDLPLTVGELCRLISPIADPRQTLANVVRHAANRWEMDVCSVYALEADGTGIVLAATVGLRQDCVGRLRMLLREGLAGLVAQEVRPVAVEEAAKHPRFKYFVEAEEDAYQSFLGVPVIYQELLQGVLIVQTVEPRRFRIE
jgi:signal transduction protein with GAF and PtsI domain